MVERASSSLFSSPSGRSVSCELEIPWSTVRKIHRYILKWYPYKINVMKKLKPQDQKTGLESACRFLERQCLQTTLFMQDRATSHIGRQIKALLSTNLGDNRVISRHFPNAGPSRSPESNPCDFWLWGFLKDRIIAEESRLYLI
ncbi:uncharacterized protein TNCV_1923581 [Trichonephila clavipes]|nr:uncharacterized protein TNCV_1923581 [Trichonephila clavipes]